MGLIDSFGKLLTAPRELKNAQQKIEELQKSSLDTQNLSEVQAWAVPLGYNDNYFSKAKPGSSVTYEVLRNMSRFHTESRMCINKKKSQMSRLEWSFKTDDKDVMKANEAIAEKAEAWLKQVGGPNIRFSKFLDKVVEDALVIDGIALYKQRAGSGAVANLLSVDPATIKLRVDRAGCTPLAPEVAFEQWIRGSKIADLTTDDMYYYTTNPRSDSPYGFSIQEQIIMIVESALRGDMYALSYFTDGTMPEGFLETPESWQVAQVQEYSEWWDAMMAGDPRQQRKVKMLPAGAKFTPSKPFDFAGLEPFKEWLLKITAASFDIQPQELGFTQTVNKSTSVEQTEISKLNGIKPFAGELEEMINDIVHGEPLALTKNGRVVEEFIVPDELQFSFGDLDAKDEAADNAIALSNINAGVISIDDYRTEKDLEPLGVGNFIMTAGGPIMVEDIVSGKYFEQKQIGLETAQAIAAKPAETAKPDEVTKPDKAAVPEKAVEPKEELKMWKRKALKDFKEGKPFRKFNSDVLDAFTMTNLPEDLKKATTHDEVVKVFDEYGKAIESGATFEIERLYNKLV